MLIFGTNRAWAQNKYCHDFELAALSLEPSSQLRNDGTRRLIFADSALTAYLDTITVWSFGPGVPTTSRERLQRFYVICSSDSLLFEKLPSLFPHIFLLGEERPNYFPLYSPNDYGFGSGNQEELDLIRAKEAWDITRGDPNVIIGIADAGFNLTHPDLAGKLALIGSVPDTVLYNFHGTSVTAAAAGITDNAAGKAAIGFNCSMMGAVVQFGVPSNNTQPGNSIYTIKLLADQGVRVVNASFGSFQPNVMDSLVIEEICDMGVTICAGAGNGAVDELSAMAPNAMCPGDATRQVGGGFCPIYPASYPRVISVTTVGHLNPPIHPSSSNVSCDPGLNDPCNVRDVHEYIVSPLWYNSFEAYPETHTHNSRVDVSAPNGYHALVAYAGNSYTYKSGTSFSTPLVSGLCGLLYSMEPCFTPSEVEYLLKTGAVNIDSALVLTVIGDSLYPNARYAGLIGAGRIDAAASCQLAAYGKAAGVPNAAVTGNVVWSGTRRLLHNTTVMPGAVLTLRDTLLLHKNRSITVEPGGKLIIDGALLTTACGGTWEGIFVKGRPNMGQSESQQGVVEIGNGARLEYAQRAVCAHGGALFSAAAGGGILRLENAVFANNAVSVEFSAYTNPNVPQLYNRSYIRNCVFTTNDDLRLPLERHITLWGVVGLPIKGCRFANEQTDGTVPESQRGVGISSFDASYFVTPNGNNLAVFEGLFVGINALHAQKIGNVLADQANFSANRIGVLASAHGFMQLTRNSFNIGRNQYFIKFPSAVGIGLLSSLPFTVEQNAFRGLLGSTTRNVGAWADNLGINTTPQIYKNTYEKLSVGNLANGQNGYTGIGESLRWQGLKYYCNTHANDSFNIALVRHPGVQIPATVSLYHGVGDTINPNVSVLPAGNSFSAFHPQGHFYNNCNHCTNALNCVPKLIKYYVNTNSTPNERPTQNCYVDIVFTNNTNTCPSHYPPSEAELDQTLYPDTKAGLRLAFRRAEARYGQLLQTYQRLIDKGNRDSLRQAMLATLNTAQARKRLQDSLEALAPYLSDSMLLAVALQSPLSRNQIRQILAEVPQPVLQGGLLEALADTLPHTPLHPNDLNWILLKSGQNKSKPRPLERGNIEALLGYWLSEMERLNTAIVQDLLRDTAAAADSIGYWLDKFGSLEMRYTLAYWHLQQGNTAAAWAEMDGLPARFPELLTPCRSCTAYQAYAWQRDLLGLLAEAGAQGRGLGELSAQEVQRLELIAGTGAPEGGSARLKARNILNFFYGGDYADLPTLPQDGPAARLVQEETEVQENPSPDQGLSIQPNPALDQVRFGYPELQAPAELRIMDVYGRTMERLFPAPGSSELHWQIPADWAAGIYFARLYGSKPASCVFSIIR